MCILKCGEESSACVTCFAASSHRSCSASSLSNCANLAGLMASCTVCCRRHLSGLFTLAGESSKAVQGLAEDSKAFWKSELTHQVIAHEEALKRHLYLQMLHAGGSPA